MKKAWVELQAKFCEIKLFEFDNQKSVCSDKNTP